MGSWMMHDKAQRMSASGVAVMLQGSGLTVRQYASKTGCDAQIKRIAAVLRSALGPNAPEEMLQASAKAYYQVLCRVLNDTKSGRNS